MPVLPKSFYVIGASIRTTRTARHLQDPRFDLAAQPRALAALLPRLAATAAGRAAGLEPRLSYAQFQTRAPLRTYAHIEPFVRRMRQGEADVLWPGRCTHFARTPGTDGEPKLLPVTAALLTHFRRAGARSLFHYAARHRHSQIFHGRHLLLGSSSTLTPLPPTGPFSPFFGDITGIASLYLPAWVQRHFQAPSPAVAAIPDWSRRIQAILEHTRGLDITLLAGLPPWLVHLATTLRQSETLPLTLRSVWPNLECIVHGGTPLAPLQNELRELAGPEPVFHEIYAATECFVAAQDATPADGLRLLGDAGVFFEFLPLADYSPHLPPSLATKTLPLEAVRTDEPYVILVTTPGGLCRYVLGDIVRFTSTAPHRLIYLGRLPQLLDTFAERVSEKDLTDALVTVAQRHGWSITDFHVAPLVASTLTGRTHGCHEWWIELKPRTIETPTGPLLAGELDAELIAQNPAYAARRRGGAMTPPIVRLVMPGFFAHWMRHHQRVGDQHKLPRSRTDRLIADELSAMACFNA
jgi:GH3 auxin-responsive promoter.